MLKVGKSKRDPVRRSKLEFHSPPKGVARKGTSMPSLKVGVSLAAVAGVALAYVGWCSFKSTQGSVETQKLLDRGLNTLDQPTTITLSTALSWCKLR